jgi:ABC-2 type transport system permease protein
MVFLLFFFGQYLVAFSDNVTMLGDTRPGGLREMIYKGLTFLNGSGETYLTFIRYQSYILMVILALAGTVVLGNDLRFGSLPYYLGKPLTAWHYLVGKGLAVAVFVNLMTTLPALLLWVEFALLYPGSYPTAQAHLLLGILGYGLLLTVAFTTLLLAATMWVRRTVPLIMVWSAVFIFARVLAETLVTQSRLSPLIRLIDLWNNASLVGAVLLSHDSPGLDGQPPWYLALAVLCGVTLLCATYLTRRIRAVDILR